MGYVGRFAPSPTGPLHLGSLFAALGSYLDAKANGGQWRLRIDDIDTPRAEPGAADAIQRSLEAHALTWDGATAFQSQNLDRYQAALDRLIELDLVFYCRCSRKSLQPNAPYPGTCRSARAARADAAIRVRCNDQTVTYQDRLQGEVRTQLGTTCGDFIVWRRDGFPAYQLATAVDDGDADITQVVRGGDLQAITGRQIYLMQVLGAQIPHYAHLPIIVDNQGIKLSKRTGAAPVHSDKASANLAAALKLLGLSVPDDIVSGPATALVRWGIEHWPPANLADHQTLELTERS